MRITADMLRTLVHHLNLLAERHGLRAEYELDHSNGGWKLEQGDGARDIFRRRMSAKECYYMIHAYKDGIHAALERK